MNITLPSLENLIWSEKGNKNFIKQHLANEINIELNLIEDTQSYIVINYETICYCITGNKNIYHPDCEFVLLSDKKPTFEKLKLGEIKFKNWIKHPKLKNSNNDEIISSWKASFNFLEEDIVTKTQGLREPQIGALYSLLGHLKISDETATVVMPTGTGKTETMLSALIANQCTKLLVTVPSDALRSQIFNKFLTLGLLKKFNVINEKAINPKVGIIRQKFNSVEELQSFFEKCNVIVSSMAIVADSSPSHQDKISEICSHLFIDEAHHVRAISWDNFRNKFLPKKVVQFTATPFRNDRKRLEGKIIFNFPLKKAQEQGYFKKINFKPIREYDLSKADKIIADNAVEQLRNDIKVGKNHILMARCSNKPRAEEIFNFYKVHTDLNPIIVHSDIAGKNDVLKNIVEKKHKIIVAVDMLGEGFDLPELKIAAFHDIRKSLPITLQFAGRFTRTKFDEELGEATFIANLADINVNNELSELYAQDADWNLLLSTLSTKEINEEINYEDFIKGFKNLNTSTIPFQNIRTALSTVVYKNHTKDWFPNNFKEGFADYENYDYKFHDLNNEKKILIIITAQKTSVEWGNFKEVYGLEWNITIVFWEIKKNLLFIHGSDKSGMYKDLAEAIIGKRAELINQINVFKAFHDIKRVSLQNVGLKEFLGKHIRFRMSVGTDVEEALSIAEKEKGQKAFVFGVGYENGEKITLGCSYKGRIWSYLKGDLKQFMDWCVKIGNKLSDPTIDANQILKDTLIPKIVSKRPNTFPVWIDWDEELYQHSEIKFKINIDGYKTDLSNTQINIINPSESGELFFELKTDRKSIIYKLKLFTTKTAEDEIYDFEIIKVSNEKVNFEYGTKSTLSTDFFYKYTPTIWFADGSSLTGNYFIELKQLINPYPKNNLIIWDWSNVDLKKESQGVNPKINDSIQYKVISQLSNDDWDIIYDDDYSGEIADVITIKRFDDRLKVNFYHLKFAIDGKVSNQISNFYEVCGQAQKSIHWKHKSGKDFFEHLLRRQNKTKNNETCSRIIKGTSDDIEKLLNIARIKIPMEFEIFIVQPSLSKQNASENILTLLGVTENFLMEYAGIKLNVIVSA
ncbi:DEAD/DEAH box helicase [Flavobacterium olei]|uniref:DEAD/DEAH box helicase n=1 Tax=Flavobacterium olei TaxID=1886782 RepID=UPI00321A91AB